MRGANNMRANQRGFTLMELMIVVAIVAILATVAYSSYQSQVMKSRRATGAACLQERAQFMERYYTTNLSYVGAEAQLGQCDGETSPYYTISFSVAPSDAEPTAYTLQLVPVAGAMQEKDTKCGTLTIDHRGQRGKSGTASTVEECW